MQLELLYHTLSYEGLYKIMQDFMINSSMKLQALDLGWGGANLLTLKSLLRPPGCPRSLLVSAVPAVVLAVGALGLLRAGGSHFGVLVWGIQSFGSIFRFL